MRSGCRYLWRVWRREQRCLGVGTLAFGATVIEYFNGTSWRVVSSPSPGLGENVLTGVIALAPNNVWAVGFYAKDVNTDRPTKTPHRAPGTAPVGRLSPVPTSGPHSVYQSNHLWGITTVSADNVWAFGDLLRYRRLGSNLYVSAALGRNQLEDCS